MKKEAQFKVRFEDDLLDRLKASADANGRTVTAEINALLSVAVPSREGVVRTQIRLPANLHDKLEAASRRIGRSLNSEMVTRLESTFL